MGKFIASREAIRPGSWTLCQLIIPYSVLYVWVCVCHVCRYEPTLVEMRKKYESAIKEKMLIRLERDRMKARVEGLNDQVCMYAYALVD